MTDRSSLLILTAGAVCTVLCYLISSRLGARYYARRCAASIIEAIHMIPHEQFHLVAGIEGHLVLIHRCGWADSYDAPDLSLAQANLRALRHMNEHHDPAAGIHAGEPCG